MASLPGKNPRGGQWSSRSSSRGDFLQHQHSSNPSYFQGHQMYLSPCVHSHIPVPLGLRTHTSQLSLLRRPRNHESLVAMSTSSTQILTAQEPSWRAPAGWMWDSLDTKTKESNNGTLWAKQELWNNKKHVYTRSPFLVPDTELLKPL